MKLFLKRLRMSQLYRMLIVGIIVCGIGIFLAIRGTWGKESYRRGPVEIGKYNRLEENVGKPVYIVFKRGFGFFHERKYLQHYSEAGKNGRGGDFPVIAEEGKERLYMMSTDLEGKEVMAVRSNDYFNLRRLSDYSNPMLYNEITGQKDVVRECRIKGVLRPCTQSMLADMDTQITKYQLNGKTCLYYLDTTYEKSTLFAIIIGCVCTIVGIIFIAFALIEYRREQLALIGDIRGYESQILYDSTLGEGGETK